MTRIAVLSAALAASVAIILPAVQPADAQGAAPRALSRHADWEVATFTEQGGRVCYAFTRAVRSQGAPAGRAAPALTVTHRANARDQVAFLSGVTFPAGTEVPVEVGATKFEFYTGGSSAFARDGKAAVAAFQKENEAVFRIPAGGGRAAVTDRVSLRGFSAAYRALDQCAASRGGAGGGAAAPRRPAR